MATRRVNWRSELHRFYTELATLCRKEVDVKISHSVEKARQRHWVTHGKPTGRE
jgi:hypothetical protein